MQNISTNREIKNTELEIWDFLYREWAKLNDITKAYDKIAMNINMNNDRYNAIFQLILDGFTKHIIITLDLFFQERKNVWSLYKFSRLSKKEVDLLKKDANEFLIMRNNKIGHLSNNFIHKNNFEYLTKKGIIKIEDILEKIDLTLQKVNPKKSYFNGWIGIGSSLNLLFEDLNKIKK